MPFDIDNPNRYQAVRKALAAPGARLSAEDRRIADEARAKTLAGIRAKQLPVPAHLKGKLYSARDLLKPTLDAIGSDLTGTPFAKMFGGRS